MVTFNQLLLLGGVAVGGYLIWTNQQQIMSFVQGLTNPPTASVSGASSLNLTGGSSPVSPVPSGCANGSIPDPTTGLCSDGSAPLNTGTGLSPGPSPVGTGVNNSLLTGTPPIGVTPTVSGGADVGGPGVNADTGPTFTDPVTGQTFNPATGQILSPGGSTQLPNFSPFIEPQVGSANLGAGASQCVQTQACMIGYTWSPTSCSCVPSLGLQTGNTQLCPNGQPANPDGTCPVSPTPTTTTTISPNPTPTPVAGTPTTTVSNPTCPAGTYWNPVVQQCNYPIVTQTPSPTTPTTVTQAPPTPATVTPPAMVTPAPTTTTTAVPAPTTTTTPKVSTNCKCCAASPHNGNCHSECCWGKCMSSSTCTSCLACCGDYEGNACKTSAVGYAYQGSFDNRFMTFANEGAMISNAVQRTSPVGRAIGKRYPTRRGARVTSRSQKVTAANPITAQIFNRPFNAPNRVAVS